MPVSDLDWSLLPPLLPQPVAENRGAPKETPGSAVRHAEGTRSPKVDADQPKGAASQAFQAGPAGSIPVTRSTRRTTTLQRSARRHDASLRSQSTRAGGGPFQ